EPPIRISLLAAPGTLIVAPRKAVPLFEHDSAGSSAEQTMVGMMATLTKSPAKLPDDCANEAAAVSDSINPTNAVARTSFFMGIPPEVMDRSSMTRGKRTCIADAMDRQRRGESAKYPESTRIQWRAW